MPSKKIGKITSDGTVGGTIIMDSNNVVLGYVQEMQINFSGTETLVQLTKLVTTDENNNKNFIGSDITEFDVDIKGCKALIKAIPHIGVPKSKKEGIE